MKFTLSWLKDYLDTTATVDEIAAGLLGIGLEVEEISDKTKALAAFTVAYVRKAEKHPNADKLRLCVVETRMAQAGRVRCAQCPDWHEGDHRAARRHHSGDRDSVRARHHPGCRVARHDVFRA